MYLCIYIDMYSFNDMKQQIRSTVTRDDHGIHWSHALKIPYCNVTMGDNGMIANESIIYRSK